jgi:hypothetical protein
MAVIIGSATTVTSTLFSQGGIVSVNFGFNPEINRLWQLGSWVPYDTYVTRQQDLSLTGYGKKDNGQGGSQAFTLTPSTSCVDATSIQITVNPGACGVNIAPFTDYFYPTSYSYSKDNFGFGVESWAFTTEQDIDNYTGDIVMLRGISTGQIKIGVGMMSAGNIGIVVNDASSKDSSGNYIEGTTGSVAAGFPGLGSSETQREVVVTSIGGSIGKQDGYQGSGSVSIPMTPVYL